MIPHKPGGHVLPALHTGVENRLECIFGDAPFATNAVDVEVS